MIIHGPMGACKSHLKGILSACVLFQYYEYDYCTLSIRRRRLHQDVGDLFMSTAGGLVGKRELAPAGGHG